jgi:hypothetical protein
MIRRGFFLVGPPPRRVDSSAGTQEQTDSNNPLLLIKGISSFLRFNAGQPMMVSIERRGYWSEA